MSKGTKQIRLGTLQTTVNNMKERLRILQETQDTIKHDPIGYNILNGRIQELDYCILVLTDRYDLK